MIYISPSPNTNSPSDWTVGNRGRDSFGDFVRSPISPVEIVCMLAEVGAWGVNLHDNDLVPIDATCRLTPQAPTDRKSTRLNSSHVKISYAVFCLKKKKKKNT